MVEDGFVEQVGRIIKWIIIVKVSGVGIVLLPAAVTKKSIVIHSPENGAHVWVSCKGAIQIFSKFFVAGAGERLFNGMGSKVCIHFAGLCVLSHGGACDDGIKVKIPGNAIVGIAFIMQPVG
ncbi:MAG: hypothetical protein HDR10_01955 [Lachnospiraceae bacterium]|nr:hypothetical protein [Lachnospiraceae bacterium]